MKNREEIQTIAERIRATVPTERIYLFGSHAYGIPGEDSDYDFFVVLPDGGMRPLDAALQIRLALADINRHVALDVLADYRSAFELRKTQNTLEKKIAREGVLLYEYGRAA